MKSRGWMQYTTISGWTWRVKQIIALRAQGVLEGEEKTLESLPWGRRCGLRTLIAHIMAGESPERQEEVRVRLLVQACRNTPRPVGQHPVVLHVFCSV